jgi:hypothetical protein
MTETVRAAADSRTPLLDPPQPPEPSPDWWRPVYLGRPAASEAIAAVAAPLLAGFSVTLIGVVAQDADKFLLPGVAMCFLALAAIFFLVALQSGFQARLYLTTPGDVDEWNPGYAQNNATTAVEMAKQNQASKGFVAWNLRSKRYYGFGLLSLLVGVAATLAPRLDAPQAAWRWAATGAAMVMLLFEFFWVFEPGWWTRHPEHARRYKIELSLYLWFRPARRLEQKAARSAKQP